jgi:hypothetical protein
MRPDIVPGATFPDYELPDHANTRQEPSVYADCLGVVPDHVVPLLRRSHPMLLGG